MAHRGRVRSVGIATLLSGVVVLSVLRTLYGQPRLSELITVVLLAPLLTGTVAGVVVGLTTQDRLDATIDGGLAALLGTIVGLFGYATFEVISAGGVPIAHRLDIYFVIAATTGLPLVAVGPVIFFVGGFVATRVAGLRRSTREPTLNELPDRD